MYLMGQFRNTTSLFHCEKVVINVLTNQNIHKKIQSHKQTLQTCLVRKQKTCLFMGKMWFQTFIHACFKDTSVKYCN